MDINFLLLVMAVVPPIFTLAAHVALRRAPNSWLVAQLVVLLVAVGAYFTVRPVSGYVAFVPLVLLVLVPTRIAIRVNRLVAAQKHLAARRWALAMRVLHPSRDWRTAPAMLDALELARLGRIEEAARHFERVGAVGGPLEHAARAQILRLQDDWQGLHDWSAARVAKSPRPDADAVVHYVRSLGELGRPEEMLAEYARWAPAMAGAGPLLDALRVAVLAFSARRAGVDAVLAGPLRHLHPAMQDLWRVTAAIAAGEHDEAARMLDAIERRPDRDVVIDGAIARRRRQIAARAPALELSDAGRRVASALEAQLDQEQRYGGAPVATAARPWTTWTFIALIAAVYVGEIVRGGATDLETLVNMGALYVPLVENGEWWRVPASMFLHYGVLHITLNLVGLGAFGPYAERAFRPGRYAVIYLASGLAAGLVHIVLARVSPFFRHAVLVGASGCIMGVFGATLAIMLRGWRRERATTARARVIAIVGFMALQSFIDLFGGNRAIAAHGSGFVAGLLLGLLFADRISSARQVSA